MKKKLSEKDFNKYLSLRMKADLMIILMDADKDKKLNAKRQKYFDKCLKKMDEILK